MKLAKLFWVAGSILINVTIGLYAYLQSKAPANLVERHQYMNDQWALFGGHWKAEFLIMTLIAIAAIYFTCRLKDISWAIISVGQLIILLTYPFMLGGYVNTTVEMAEMANQMAIVTFIFGNLIFMVGLFNLYLTTQRLPKWLKYLAVILSAASSMLFLLIYMEFTSWGQMLFAAPIINLLYLINAYHGVKMKA